MIPPRRVRRNLVKNKRNLPHNWEREKNISWGLANNRPGGIDHKYFKVSHWLGAWKLLLFSTVTTAIK
jgi:hypothetical protein